MGIPASGLKAYGVQGLQGHRFRLGGETSHRPRKRTAKKVPSLLLFRNILYPETLNPKP